MCVSLESPHRGDSIEYTQHTNINIKRKPSQIIQSTIMSAAMGFFCKGLKNEFERVQNSRGIRAIGV